MKKVNKISKYFLIFAILEYGLYLMLIILVISLMAI